MRRLGVLFLLAALLLSGCGAGKSVEAVPVTETKTVYFVNFGTLEGEEVAAVRLVEAKGADFSDTMQEETYTFADNVHIEYTDPAQNDSTEMDLARFKNAALMLQNDSPVIFSAEVADGRIYSVRMQPGALSVPEPVKQYCPDCGTTFSEPDIFENHDCKTEPEPTPAPTPTPSPAPSPVPAGTAGSLQCPVCGDWYAAGDDYLHHSCVGYSVACPVCGKWYEAGYAFLSHGCVAPVPTKAPAAAVTQPPKAAATPAPTPTASAAAKTLQCPICANWYAEGNEYLDHQCVGYSVACPICGKWYEAGRAFLTHACAAQTPAPTVTAPPASSDGRVQCPTCKYWYDPGFDYDNHRCAPVMDDPTGRTQQCPVCQIIFPKGTQYDNHHCQGRPGKTCPDCGEYFFDLPVYDSHVCAGRQQKTQCQYCFGWFTSAEYAAHDGNCPRGPKPGTCPDCGQTYPPNGYSDHSFVCPVSPQDMVCPHCGTKILRADDIQYHFFSCPSYVKPTNEPNLIEQPLLPEQLPQPEQTVQPEETLPQEQSAQPQQTQESEIVSAPEDAPA